MGYSRSFPGPVGAQTSDMAPRWPTKLAGRGVLVAVRVPLGAVLRSPRRVSDGSRRISRQILGFAEVFWA